MAEEIREGKDNENMTNPAAGAGAKAVRSLEEARKKLQGIVDDTRRGSYELAVPFMADDREITHLEYDFGALNGWEFADAMDKGASRRNDAENMTAKQGLYLFAAASSKRTEHVDEDDIIERMSMEDGIKAGQIAQLFFKAASQLGNLRISNA